MRTNGPLSPSQAVFRGHLAATLPALLVVIAVFLFCAHWIAQPMRPPAPSYRLYFERLGMVSAGALAAGWLWWSVAIIRWRLWVKSRGADETETRRLAQRTLLLWPKATLLEKSGFGSRGSA